MGLLKMNETLVDQLKKEDVKVGDTYYVDTWSELVSANCSRESIDLVPTVVTALHDNTFYYQTQNRLLYKIVLDFMRKHWFINNRILRRMGKEEREGFGMPRVLL